MILVQNAVCLTGIIGFLLVSYFSGLGDYLYVHRVFSYNRKKNLMEVYQLVGIETICVSGFLWLIYKVLEIRGLLEPMGIFGLLVVVCMILLAGLFSHGYMPMFKGIALLVMFLVALPVLFFFLFIIWHNVQSNLYLTQIAIVLVVLNLFMWGLHIKLWGNADFD